MLLLSSILLGVAIVFVVSLGSLFLQKKHNEKNGISIAPDEYLSVDLIVYLFVSTAFMLPIVCISTIEFDVEPLGTINESGLLLAAMLFAIGKCSHWVFSKLAKLLGFTKIQLGGSVVYLISCFLYVIMLFRLNECKCALTFIAIVIGRFVWFDTTKEKIWEEASNIIDEIKKFPIGTTVFFISIAIAVIIGNEIFIGIAFGGNLISLISFMFLCSISKNCIKRTIPND